MERSCAVDLFCWAGHFVPGNLDFSKFQEKKNAGGMIVIFFSKKSSSEQQLSAAEGRFCLFPWRVGF
jgi:hypothetical protein